jgi:hypothetical protein
VSQPLPAYETLAEFVLPIRVLPNATPGRHELFLTVLAQPCNDNACLLPQTHELRLTLTVQGE